MMARAPRRTPMGVDPIIQVHPTRRCNLRCQHCYTSSAPEVAEALPLRMLAACLDDAVGLGYRQVAVSGGEPLLYPQLRALLAHAKANGMTTSLTTNGLLATPGRWEPLADVIDVLAISVDGLPGSHDLLRQRAGSFDRVVENAKRIGASGCQFGFIFTLTQHNVDELQSVAELARECGARGVHVHPLTPYGRAVAMGAACPDAIELAAAMVEAQRLVAELGVAVHVDAVGTWQMRAHRDALVPLQPVHGFSAVAPLVIVGSDAAVTPLAHNLDGRFDVGSLHAGTLASLADQWLARGTGDRLAQLCAQAFTELVEAPDSVYYWYGEVAKRSRRPYPSILTRGADVRSVASGDGGLEAKPVH